MRWQEQGVYQKCGLNGQQTPRNSNNKLPPGSSNRKDISCNAGDLGSIPGSGKSPREEHGDPPQYSCLKNSRDIGAWWATVHGATKSQTPLCVHTCGRTHRSLMIWLGGAGAIGQGTNIMFCKKKYGNFVIRESVSLCLHSREGNGNPLQYSCLENPTDGGAW